VGVNVNFYNIGEEARYSECTVDAGYYNTEVVRESMGSNGDAMRDVIWTTRMCEEGYHE